MVGSKNHNFFSRSGSERYLLPQEADNFIRQLESWGNAHGEFAKALRSQRFLYFFEQFENPEKFDAVDFEACPAVKSLRNTPEVRKKYFEDLLENSEVSSLVFFNINTGFSENNEFLIKNNVSILSKENINMYHVKKQFADFGVVDSYREFSFSPVIGVSDQFYDVFSLVDSIQCFYVNIFDNECNLYGDRES